MERCCASDHRGGGDLRAFWKGGCNRNSLVLIVDIALNFPREEPGGERHIENKDSL